MPVKARTLGAALALLLAGFAAGALAGQAWRGRGVASALVVRSLQAFEAAGLSHAALGVDGDNPTGAAHLYRSLGFEPHRRSVTYEIAVA